MKHSFIICAYKESPYLEKCIQSLKKQTVQTEIVICTSTPNKYISDLANKYKIKLYIREGESDIQNDWNYACEITDSDWVTVAHQDDLYNRHYAEYIHKNINKYSDAIMLFTGYKPIHNGKVSNDINCKLRRLLRLPMKIDFLSDKKIFKRGILAFGNSICCSSVTYNRRMIPGKIFTSQLRFSLDWDTYAKLAFLKGRFVYIDCPLTYFRIHEEATTAYYIKSNRREEEDMYMFRQFWPEFICRLIIKAYKLAYKNYKV